jgi:sugar phosphate permease
MATTTMPLPRKRLEHTLLAGISAAHLISHFHILMLPTLFPFLKERLDVGFVELGLAITVFNIVSGFTQAPMGFVVDRFGARRVLVGGLWLGGLAFVLFGSMPSYHMLLAAAVIAGLANCVYHPADYAILSASMSEGRVGRAFSIHTFAGYLGGAITPPVMLTLIWATNLETAIIAGGVFAWIVAIALMMMPAPPPQVQATAADGAKSTKSGSAIGVKQVLTPAVLSMMLFFALLSLSNGGIQTYSVVALMDMYGVTINVANAALTAFLVTAAAGVLFGGWIADKTNRHGDVAAAAFASTAAIILAVALLPLPAPVLAFAMGSAGFLSGMIAPSRDMLVRKASPPGAAGRVFGIVSTGFNIGGIIGPMLFGWIMDQGQPRYVFLTAVVFMLMTVTLAYITDRRAGARAPVSAPAE